MKSKTGSNKAEYTIIAGCGRLGAALANSLSEAGVNVLIIDIDKDAFRKLSPMYAGITLIGDATSLPMLQDAQIEKATAVICVTNSDNTNILIAEIAKNMYDIKRVISRLNDPERECVYHEMNIATICPTILSINAINTLLKDNDEENRQ